MADISKLCMGCMKEKPDNDSVCPYCKFDETTAPAENALELKASLQDRYIIGRVISSNGEGFTYLGYDKQLNMAVRIREFFPGAICSRIGATVKPLMGSELTFDKLMSEYLELARALARMRSLSAILPVYDIFEANGTAYYVSETVESITLRDFLLRNGGSLTFEQARPLFMPIMSTLASLHAVDIIHRGISPDSLIIGKDGKLRLTGFCIADVRTARTELNAELFKGYAAIEQYGFDGDQGPWTDIYALAATMYRTLVGNPPPEATSRVTNDKMIIPAAVAETLPAYVMSGLANALQILPNERTQSIEVFRDEISASPGVVTKAKSDSVSRAKKPPKKVNSKKYVFISAGVTAAVLIILLLVLGFAFKDTLFGSKEPEEITNITTTAPTTANITYDVPDPDKGEAPNLVGYNYADFMATMDENVAKTRGKYNIVIQAKRYDAKAKGTILEQDIKPGSIIKKGDTIKIVVSLGTEKFAMPNLVGLTYEEAYVKLLEYGFQKENIRRSEKYVTTMEPDTVVDMDPKVSETVSGDLMVTLYMNSYVPPTEPPTEAPTDPPTEEPTYWEEPTTLFEEEPTLF